MSRLRSLLFAIFQIVFTPPYAVLCCALFFLPARPRFWVIKQWCSANVWAARVLCGIRYVVVGRENIPSKSHLILSKHSSTFETVALNNIFYPIAFVAKRELLWLPFFGWAFALASPITINRSAGSQALQQMVEQGRDRLAKGFWICHLSGGHADQGRHARQVQVRRGAPGDRHGSPDPAGGAQRGLPLAQGRLRARPPARSPSASAARYRRPDASRWSFPPKSSAGSKPKSRASAIRVQCPLQSHRT